MATARPCWWREADGTPCPKLTLGTRCAQHEAIYQEGHQAARAELYGAHHRALREWWRPLVEAGVVECGRCGVLVVGEWDLDHLPDGTERPSHRTCNRGARSSPGS